MLRRTSSDGTRPAPFLPPPDMDRSALSPTNEPHRANIEEALSSSSLDPLTLIAYEPLDHRDVQALPPPVVPQPPVGKSSVTRLRNDAGRPHPVFSSPVYHRLLHSIGSHVATVAAGPNPGANADYIAALARCDPSKVSACIVARNGAITSFGDSTVFTAQSIVKMIILLAALRHAGLEAVERAIECLPSHMPFNGPSTVGLLDHPEAARFALRCLGPEATTALLEEIWNGGDCRIANASCNLGAIAATAFMPGEGGSVGRQAHLMRLMASLGPRRSSVSKVMETAHTIHGSELLDTAGNQMRARVVLHLLSSVLPAEFDRPLQAFQLMQGYIAACALSTDVSNLAAAFSAFVTGENVFTGERVVDADHARFILEQMRVGGLYEESLAFFERTGLVAKSGVGGGIVAICPATGLTIAVHASHIDRVGNSTRGMALLERIASSPEFLAVRRACNENDQLPP